MVFIVSCMRSTKRFIKNADLFKTDIGMTYKGDSHFGTYLGGCISIMLLFAVTIVFVTSAINIAHSPQYNESVEIYHYGYGSNEEILSIPMTDYTFAYMLGPREMNFTNDYDFDNIDATARIQFYSLTKVNGTVTDVVWHNATLCKDKFKDV